ncbi:MAG: hypothetical protein M3321_08885 [Actinomycetota bacterium]|nr:hypothetical protein [Actinomycetota bacterium]
MVRGHWRYALAAVAGAAFLAGCGGSDNSSTPAAAPEAGHAAPVRELYEFDSIPVLVATSDVVAVATVVGVRDGAVVGDDEAGVRLTEVTVRLGEVLRGDPSARTLRVEVDDAIVASRAWLRAGERSLFFLQRKDDASFRPVNSQAIYHVATPEGRLDAVGRDAFSQDVAARSLAGLRSEVRAANEQIAAGTVKAQVPSLERSRGSS